MFGYICLIFFPQNLPRATDQGSPCTSSAPESQRQNQQTHKVQKARTKKEK